MRFWATSNHPSSRSNRSNRNRIRILCTGSDQANSCISLPLYSRHNTRIRHHHKLKCEQDMNESLTVGCNYPVTIKSELNDGLHHSRFIHAFKKHSTESLVYDLPQVNVLHKCCLMFQLVLYSRYRSIAS
ncbi:hypothetical protein T265_10938 [Opisthorchis viverrini]|uniref:Uncharacterized protein n=1 Tax=Opisthorchis viverrini TaxID=6198 RepID=A0A074Z0G8_OPIVI|nr:hypothetical protein T265_10938 [Opisthorchis viverrini]KER20536.1 hypothetical protein T265_10938 [Opisthorchis viverrini]